VLFFSMPRDTSGTSTRLPSARRSIARQLNRRRRRIAQWRNHIDTSDHIRELVAPPKRNDDLAASIVARDEPMRAREYIRELCPAKGGGGQKKDTFRKKDPHAPKGGEGDTAALQIARAYCLAETDIGADTPRRRTLQSARVGGMSLPRRGFPCGHGRLTAVGDGARDADVGTTTVPRRKAVVGGPGRRRRTVSLREWRYAWLGE
jgi:hypothetical protein